MVDVFVSYKSEDRKRVEPLVRALELEGFNVWWDAHIEIGEGWRETIQQRLDAAACVIVAWSKASVGPEGRFVRDEAARALQRDVYLPVLIDEVAPPLGFGEVQALSLISWRGDREDFAYQALLRAACALTDREPRLAPSPRSERRLPLSRRAALVSGGAAVVGLAAAAGWWTSEKSDHREAARIAVMPFANLSGDPTQAYFSDGLAEELRSALSHIPGLAVIGRVSSEMMRDSSVRDISRQLGATDVLTGSVRRSASVIRISAQLVNGASGVERWSQSYDRESRDLLSVQAEVAQNVASVLRLRFDKADHAVLAAGGTNSPDALDAFLQARYLLLTSQNAIDVKKAIDFLDLALRRDPDYAEAMSYKAFALFLSTQFSSDFNDNQKVKAEALHIAKLAATKAPLMATAYTCLAPMLESSFQFREADRVYRKARQLNPSYVSNYSGFLASIGKIDKAFELNAIVMRYDPLSVLAKAVRLHILYCDKRYEECVAGCADHLASYPTDEGRRALLASAQLLAGEIDGADDTIRRLSDDKPRLTLEALSLVKRGRTAAAGDALERLRLRGGDTGHSYYAEVLAQLGEKDAAFSALDAAYRYFDDGLVALRTDPFLDPLRKDPRFKALDAKLDFPA